MPFDANPEPVVDPIVAVLELGLDIFQKKKWCRGHYAADRNGEGVALYEGVYSVCLLGAIHLAAKKMMTPSGKNFSALANNAELRVSYVLGGVNIAVWNDHLAKTKADVVAVFDKAIQSQKARSHAV